MEIPGRYGKQQNGMRIINLHSWHDLPKEQVGKNGEACQLFIAQIPDKLINLINAEAQQAIFQQYNSEEIGPKNRTESCIEPCVKGGVVTIPQAKLLGREDDLGCVRLQ